MKLLGILKNKETLHKFCDGFLLPLEGFSVSYKVKYTLSEIRKFAEENPDKEFFVIINKFIFNDEVENLKNILMELAEIGITGILFYDFSIISLVRKLHLDILLVWNQTHMVTNYNTVRYYYEKGVKGAVLANEITFDEMREIRSKTDSKLFVSLLYQPIMSFSRRKLLTNYYHFSLKDDVPSELLIREKVQDGTYIVREEKDGTSIFLNKIINVSPYVDTLVQDGFDYGIVDFSCLSDEIEEKCGLLISSIINGKRVTESVQELENLVGNETGFLFRKTIYKVK